MTPALRPELTRMPERIKMLPVDERGYPTPWFVKYIDGKPEFRVADAVKWTRAVLEKRCWVCGGSLGVHRVFVLGPMCGITRTTTEPPCHLDCARWSAMNCPFLTRPHMVRRDNDLPDQIQTPGISLPRNAGVTLLWITNAYTTFRDPAGLPLIEVGEPTAMEAWCQGRAATWQELLPSIEGGLPALQQAALQDGPEGTAELNRQYARAIKLFGTLLRFAR